MVLDLNPSVSASYHGGTQIARVLSEHWIARNMYCPRCGNGSVSQFTNNRPVADFFCPNCNSQYELKSKQGPLDKKVLDGAYGTMIQRILSGDNPDFFFMNYSKKSMTVLDLVFVPKHFFVPEIIEKRKPLPKKARRAGWVGCNILMNQIPLQGRVYIVKNGSVQPQSIVMDQVKKGDSLINPNIQSRSWIFDILNYVNCMPVTFSLQDMYAFEPMLAQKHPQNQNIRPKIRQQLQFLRDKGFIDFIGRGKYKRL